MAEGLSQESAMHRLVFACIVIALMALGSWANGQNEPIDSQSLDSTTLTMLQSKPKPTDAIIQASASETDFPVTPNNVQNDRVFNIVVIGDSIAWGAGLTKYEKYSYLVAKEIAEQSGRPVNVKVLAHTGATLKKITSDREIQYPDIPSSNPTLFGQVDKISNHEAVDLILVSGGANDVDLKKLNSLNINWVFNHVFGGSTLKEIQTQSWEKIETPMFELLKKLLNKCPNSKIVVTGYYSAISTDSKGLTEFYKALEPKSQWVSDRYRNADDPAQLNELTTKADTFYAMSNLALNSAKSRANKESGQNRIEFARIVFPPDKSYGTDNSWLWKIEGNEGNYKTDDHKYDVRASLAGMVCDFTNRIPVCDDPTESKLAAVGHPNVEGAAEYYRTIVQKVSETWPDLLHPMVLDFQVSPTSVTSGESFKISYKVSSNCSKGLKQVELWRKDESGDWQEIKPPNTLAGETGPLTDTFTDSPSAPGKYWYGVHVVDNAGNWNDQKNSNTKGQPSSFEPIEVEVKTANLRAVEGDTLRLSEGYGLAFKSIDINGNKIYVELNKDGQVIDSSLIKPPNKFDGTYVYVKNKGQPNPIPVIKVHFKNSFRGNDFNLATVDNIWQASYNDPSNVIKNSNDKIILTSESPLKLEDGYELDFKSPDIDGNKVYVELTKEGQLIDSSIVIPTNDIDRSYEYTKDEGSSGTVPLVKISFKNSFRGSECDIATVDGIWQVSNVNPSNVIRNSYNEVTFTSKAPLKLEEGYELALKSNDGDGIKSYVELSKDGHVIDSSILVFDNIADQVNAGSIKADGIYKYVKNKEQIGTEPLIKVHFVDSIRGKDSAFTTIDSVWQLSDSNPTNVIRNSNSKIMLTPRMPLKLEDGYELVVMSIDIDGKKIYIELSKNGQVVDSSVVIPSNDEETYVFIKGNGQTGAVPAIKVHFKNSFRGAELNYATIDGIWQTSDGNPSNVIRNSNDEVILTSGIPLDLMESYQLAIKALDIDGNKVYVELNKDGQVVDSSVIKPANEFDETYEYNMNKGQAGATPVIKIHFKNSFLVDEYSLATVDNIWQVSESDLSNVLINSNEDVVLSIAY